MRNVCFTLNNPTESEIQFIKDIKIEGSLRFLVGQLEIGDSEETIHFQGYAEATEGLSNQQWKILIGSHRTHLETRRGSAQQARDYSRKDSTRLGDELGGFHVEFGRISKQVKDLIRFETFHDNLRVVHAFTHDYFISKMMTQQK